MEQKAIFNINIPKEYRALAQDISRMLTIQIITNYLLYLNSPDKFKFLSADFIKTLLFLIIGIITYWLVTNKLFNFSDKDGFYHGEGN